MSRGTGWTKEQLENHPKRESLLKGSVVPQRMVKTFCFAMRCNPMGKPRMTQRDKWQKRPVVIRYREFCDCLRERAAKVGFNPEWDCFAVKVKAYICMPASWSKKKKERMNGKLVRTKPDWDNVGKAVCDALFKEDAVLGGGSCWKRWCANGDQRLVIWIKYLKRE